MKELKSASAPWSKWLLEVAESSHLDLKWFLLFLVAFSNVFPLFLKTPVLIIWISAWHHSLHFILIRRRQVISAPRNPRYNSAVTTCYISSRIAYFKIQLRNNYNYESHLDCDKENSRCRILNTGFHLNFTNTQK